MATFLTYAGGPWRLIVLIGFGVCVLAYELHYFAKRNIKNEKRNLRKQSMLLQSV